MCNNNMMLQGACAFLAFPWICVRRVWKFVSGQAEREIKNKRGGAERGERVFRWESNGEGWTGISEMWKEGKLRQRGERKVLLEDVREAETRRRSGGWRRGERNKGESSIFPNRALSTPGALRLKALGCVCVRVCVQNHWKRCFVEQTFKKITSVGNTWIRFIQVNK